MAKVYLGVEEEEQRPEVAAPYYPKAQTTTPVAQPVAAPAPVVEETRPEAVMPYYPKEQAASPVVTQPVAAQPVQQEVAQPVQTQPTTPQTSYYLPQTVEAQKVIDLSPYLRQQAAAQIEQELASLKGAYEKSLAGISAAEEALPGTYEVYRNSAAAQNDIARKAFAEQAAATGLNTGAGGQAELSRSAVYRNVLAELDRAQADEQNALMRQRADLQAEYEAAIAQARANGNNELASALYQELARQEEQTRLNEENRLDREYQNILFNYNAEQDRLDRQAQAEQTLYNQQMAEKENAQKRVAEYLAANGDPARLSPDLLAASGYTTGELLAMQAYYEALRQQEAAQAVVEEPAKPDLSATYVGEQIALGNLTPGVLAAYEYYHGTPYVSPVTPTAPVLSTGTTTSVPLENSGKSRAEYDTGVRTSAADRVYGSAYTRAGQQATTMLEQGASAEEISAMLDKYPESELSTAGGARILRQLGIL